MYSFGQFVVSTYLVFIIFLSEFELIETSTRCNLYVHRYSVKCMQLLVYPIFHNILHAFDI